MFKRQARVGIGKATSASAANYLQQLPRHFLLPRNHPSSNELNCSPEPTTRQWNYDLKVHIDAGDFRAALSLFSAMRHQGSANLDHYTLPLLNRTTANRIELGEAFHSLAIRIGLAGDVYFCNTMVEAYARNGRVPSARRLFEEMPLRDVVTWTSLLSGYVSAGDSPEAFHLFCQMRGDGLEVNQVTMAVLLRACCGSEHKVAGCQLQAFATKAGLQSHDLVQNSILSMFSRLACFEEVMKLFVSIRNRSIASWNILLSSYSFMGDVSGVVECYRKMRLEVTPSNETLTLLISAFAKCEHLPGGREVHCNAIKTGQIDSVLRATLVDFYIKCGELKSAVILHDECQLKSSTIWSIMMWGLIQNGEFLEAVNVFERMQKSVIKPCKDVLRALVVAYTNLGALLLGRGLHGYMTRNCCEATLGDTLLQTSLVNIYAKCGSILSARKCFDKIVIKDTIAWTSMLEGYAIHGLGLEALELFYQMQKEGIRPNSITFLILLSACSHSGLVREGCALFNCMENEFGIEPNVSHYTCLVDLLGRSGKLHEALDVINNMSVEPDARIWGALLASCRTQSDVVLGDFAAKKVFELEPDNVGYQVVLSNIFASDGMWEETESSRNPKGENNFRKKPGWSSIQVKCGLTMFVSWDKSHSQLNKIYEIIEVLRRHSEEL
ncbi:pentatricopeptide repeat-containing protein DOT4, chloroplastic-like [Zingiber officinale]|uniref:Uncharacterized protein n=1 Tax=Zingiber officinale TaxID=94328 RepID=A0A8J5GZ28_ZINOF|nr:pentatricopeptide repeat-containing protein DOT4, chloroplastic-like [Zingiber officinale]KAG6516102.1 hypothetical protein ZIOFF_026550 [Zingiber officinale]